MNASLTPQIVKSVGDGGGYARGGAPDARMKAVSGGDTSNTNSNYHPPPMDGIYPAGFNARKSHARQERDILDQQLSLFDSCMNVNNLVEDSTFELAARLAQKGDFESVVRAHHVRYPRNRM